MQKRFHKALRITGYLIAYGLLSLGLWLTYGAWRVGQHELLPRINAKGVPGVWLPTYDAQIHLQMWGNPLHQPLLLVHGAGAWAETWQSNVKAMVDAGFYVVAMDLPPFGYSTLSSEGDYSRTAQARRISAVIKSLGTQSVRVLAHSFGAGPTVEAVMQMPERVEQLVLVDAALGLSTASQDTCTIDAAWRGVWSWRGMRTAWVSALLTEPAMSEFWLRQFVEKKDVVTPERVAIYQKPFHNQLFSAGIGDWAFQFATGCEKALSTDVESYRQLEIPVSIVWGELDQVTPLSQAKDLQALLPKAKLWVLPEVGHIPQIEDPVLFNKSITQVLLY